jgi:hypothetical protein
VKPESSRGEQQGRAAGESRGRRRKKKEERRRRRRRRVEPLKPSRCAAGRGAAGASE